MAKRTVTTVLYKQFNAENLVVADEPYATPKGGKMISLKYKDKTRLNDILRLQTPSLTLGTVWDNMDPSTKEQFSYTVALNLDQLRPGDVDNVTEEPSESASDSEKLAYAQYLFMKKIDSVDDAVIDKATQRGWFKEKSKNLERDIVKGKMQSTIKWPSESKYTLSMRAKIKISDTDFSVRKIFICDQEGRDVTYYKHDPETAQSVYIYNPAFATLENEPIFNIEALRTPGTRVKRAVLESNSAWQVSTGLCCSWGITNLQIEVTSSDVYGQNAWAADEASSEVSLKKNKSKRSAGDDDSDSSPPSKKRSQSSDDEENDSDSDAEAEANDEE